MPVTKDDGTVEVNDLAEFIYGRDYGYANYQARWKAEGEGERDHYRMLAQQLVTYFDIYPK